MEIKIDKLLSPRTVSVIQVWCSENMGKELASFYENGRPVECFALHSTLTAEISKRLVISRIKPLTRILGRLSRATEDETVQVVLLSALLHDVGKLTYTYRKGRTEPRHELVSTLAVFDYLNDVLGEKLGAVAAMSILLHHPPMIRKAIEKTGLEEITKDTCMMMLAEEVNFLPDSNLLIRDLLNAFGFTSTKISLPNVITKADCRKVIDSLRLIIERSVGELELSYPLYRAAVGGVLSILIPSDYLAARLLRKISPSVFWNIVEKEVEKDCALDCSLLGMEK